LIAINKGAANTNHQVPLDISAKDSSGQEIATLKIMTEELQEVHRTFLVEEEGKFRLKSPPSDGDEIELKESIPEKLGDSEFDKMSFQDISESLKTRILQVFMNYPTVFSDKLKPKGCKIKPYVIKLIVGPHGAVKFPKSMQQPVRKQTPQAQEVIASRIAEWKSNGIVQPCNTAYYSQIHVVFKQGKKPRLCIDYRALNSISEVFQWPIPDIKHTLPKLQGQKYLATIDLLDAYGQVSLHPDSQILTAFRTDSELLMFTRLPFGLCSAVSSFQAAMVLEVLSGLVGVICEVYLDDIVVYAETEDNFIANLKTVLERLRKCELLVKASKIKIGTRVQFLGHIVDSMGICLSDDRKNALAKITKPSTVQELYCFLGTCNYFRDFIRNYSLFSGSLNKMLDPKNKRRKLEWSEAASADYEKLRQLVIEAPKLIFV